MQLTEHLKWRYATKRFDPKRKVSEKDMVMLKDAIRLSASSYGLQLYHVLVIENEALREELKPFTWNQPQTVEASHLLVFCIPDDVRDKHINSITALKAKASGATEERMQGYASFVRTKLQEKTLPEHKEWMARQVYIALGNALAACAALEIDSCPIEGFEPEAYDKVLQLEEKGLRSVVVMAVGYRSADDHNQRIPKVRRASEELFTEL